MLSVLLPLPDPTLNDLARHSAEIAMAAIAPTALAKDVGVAVGIVDRAAGTVRWGGWNENGLHYPASTIKLFWLAFAQSRIADGKLRPTPELDRAMHEMIVDSSNTATGAVVEATTGAVGGPELPPGELKPWMDRRQAANRYFRKLGYQGVNVLQITWDEGPTGVRSRRLGRIGSCGTRCRRSPECAFSAK